MGGGGIRKLKLSVNFCKDWKTFREHFFLNSIDFILLVFQDQENCKLFPINFHQGVGVYGTSRFQVELSVKSRRVLLPQGFDWSKTVKLFLLYYFEIKMLQSLNLEKIHISRPCIRIVICLSCRCCIGAGDLLRHSLAKSR